MKKKTKTETKTIHGVNDQKIINKIYNILEDKELNFKKIFINNIPYKQYEIKFASYNYIILNHLTNFLQKKSNVELEVLHNVPDYDYETLIIRIKSVE
jgi:hypothetical protein